MQVAEAKLGRIFVARLEDGELLPGAIERLARDKGVKAAVVMLLGCARDGKLVVGPRSGRKKQAVFIQPFLNGHEVLGLGTIFAGATGPELHLHIAAGRNRKALAGCGRPGFRVHLIIEAVIIEMKGLNARRARDAATGFHLLTLG